MALLDEVKLSLRVTSNLYDAEVQGLIDAALADLHRLGINPYQACNGSITDALVKSAVILYCKARFGYDNSDASRFEDAYRQTVIDMMNSPRTYAPPAPPEGVEL